MRERSKGWRSNLGVHRRMVREALADAVPRERKIAIRAKPRLEPVRPFIEAILEADRTAPRKQRHTAHRIWCRIGAEMPAVKVAESSIRRFVRERKIQLRLVGQETFIPQSYVWGGEAQVDWYEAYVDSLVTIVKRGASLRSLHELPKNRSVSEKLDV